MQGNRHSISFRAWAPALALVCGIAGCATVLPTMPRPPDLHRASGTEIGVLVTGELGTAEIAAEVVRLLAPVGLVERGGSHAADSLLEACSADRDLIVFLTVGRTGFASNAAERNTLFIYETAVVVGIPVTLISAATWPWSGEITADAQLQTFWCDSGDSAVTRALAVVRAEGYGFVSEGRLRSELEAEVPTALARALVEAADKCGRFTKGGEKCTE